MMTFAAIAPRVTQRLLVRRWLGLLGRQLAAAAVALALLAGLLLWMGWPVWLTLLATVAWLLSAAFWAWKTKPDAYEALAHWDQVRGRSEAFAAAWWFERQDQRTTLQQKHLQAELAHLEPALQSLAADIPLRIDWRLLIPLLLAVLPVAVKVARMERPVPLDEDTKRVIAAEVDRLAAKDWKQNQVKGLTEEEKKALAELQQKLKATASELKEKSSKASARDVLGQLDKDASEADALAQKLGAALGDWASQNLIDALKVHTETADLGDATSSKQTKELAAAAGTLAAQLRQPAIAPETLERLTGSFTDAASKAEPGDKDRLVGKPVLGAAAELAQSHADAAAGHLETLVTQMNELAQRESAQKELQKLAQQIRDAGNRGSGSDAQSKSGGMTQMKGSAQQGQQATNTGPAPKVGQVPPGAANQAQNNLQPPGLGRSQANASMQQGAMTQAQPGSQQSLGQASGTLLQKSENQQQPTDPSRPRLIAPVPGKPGNQQPNLLMVNPNQPPPPGGPGAIIPLAGRDPGAGTADLNAGQTTPSQASRSGLVDAAPSGEGPSTTRTVESQNTKSEDARRAATQESLQQIQLEEAALDDLPLPPGRREHIRRYFNELRKRFEQ